MLYGAKHNSYYNTGHYFHSIASFMHACRSFLEILLMDISNVYFSWMKVQDARKYLIRLTADTKFSFNYNILEYVNIISPHKCPAAIFFERQKYFVVSVIWWTVNIKLSLSYIKYFNWGKGISSQAFLVKLKNIILEDVLYDSSLSTYLKLWRSGIRVRSLYIV